LLGFWSERDLDLPQSIYTRLSLVPPLGLSLWRVYVYPPGSEFKGLKSLRTGTGTPQEAAYTRVSV